MKESSKKIFASANLAIIVIIGAAIVMILPIFNGGPFFYFDTSAYIEQVAKAVKIIFHIPADADIKSLKAPSETQVFGSPGKDKVILAGRSIYFSIFAYAGWITSIWLPIIIQAFVLSWLVIILFRNISTPMWEYSALLTLAFASCLSSASFFSGLLMPDVWSGFLILALSIHWSFYDKLSKFEKSMIFLIILFSVLSHNSHLALLTSMIILFMFFNVVSKSENRIPLKFFCIPLLALFFGILGQLSFSTAVRVLTGSELVQRPFITAHLTDLGPGTRLAQETCPESGFALCEFDDRLPVDWISFLFDRDPETGIFAAATPSVQKALAAEQAAFALRTLVAEPVTTLTGLLVDGVSQLWTLSLDNVALSRKNNDFIVANFPSDLSDRIRDTRVYDNPGLSGSLQSIIQITAALSTVVLIIWAISRFRQDVSNASKVQAIDKVILVLILGVIVNALICGILASPYGRFQARIIWILPLIAALIISEFRLTRPFKKPQLEDKIA